MDDEKLVLITIDAIESEIDASESNGEMNEPATPLEIASRAQVDVATVNGAIARLMRRGLVRPGPPGRFVDRAGPSGHESAVYELTDMGRAELETLG